eukprot:CAMPEP_0196153800 /NCGR_PEP_ID=MMETSP0910-20130528/37835_1 /TAXON_ID=49265 /ORGANISM="Thalassiosira rotula, Strain GSO102" /LENGTH=409 /DNA_ID=CAMNT_0041417699 /DNA_START=546 /DNA_END=1775 /DNA_ORIENTATION=+
MSRTTPQTQTYTFGNEISPVRPGRKHRRGRGYKNAINAANNRNTGASPSQSSSLPTTQPQQSHQQQPQSAQPLQPQANYAFSTGDDGSLAYSASSSVQSAESSNDSSFAEIFKVIGSNELDNTAEGSACEIKDFIAKQSKAASVNDSLMRNGNVSSNPAVARWMQRNPEQQQQHHHQAHQQQRKKQQPNKSRQAVDWNYSKDSIDDEDFEVDFSEFDENLLETIAGKRDEGNNIIAHRVTVTSQQAANDNPHPFFSNDPFASNNISPYNSAPSSPHTSSRHASSSSGHVTPPPNSRCNKRTSTPPYTSTSNGSSGSSSSSTSSPISRTNSRHSKSSSDGSFDSPIASSPPSSLSPSSSKPPSRARCVPMRKLSRRNSDEKEQVAITEDSLSEAFYAKSWMCGFADSFNF